MTHLAHKKISSFSLVGHGFFFWNFRTDLDEPYWSYMLAVERGWIPTGSFNDPAIQDSCRNEDSFAYKCILKRDIPDKNIQGAVDYIVWKLNKTATDDEKAIATMEGKDLREKGGDLIQSFFENFRGEGVTCDFGGIAMLIEENRTITDDDYLGWDDDQYIHETIVYKGPKIWQLVLIILFGILIGSFVGFVVGMRTNKKFNRAVRESRLFRPISNSKNSLVRSSLALDQMQAPQFTAEERRLLNKY